MKLGIPVFELEQWPASTIQEYRALNVVSPFIQDAENWREGIHLQMIRNQNVTDRKHYKTAEELLPYLQEYPEHLEHPTVKKVLGLLGACVNDEQLATLTKKIIEEIEIEEAKEDPDVYLIHRLSEIYLSKTKAAK